MKKVTAFFFISKVQYKVKDRIKVIYFRLQIGGETYIPYSILENQELEIESCGSPSNARRHGGRRMNNTDNF